MTQTLILVHPGSLMGSANSNLGRSQAGAVRDGVILEMEKHDGPLFVIDGAFSDELCWGPLGRSIDDALARNAKRGHVVMRLWGDDGGEAPYEGWTPMHTPDWVGKPVFDSQEEAATAISGILPTSKEIVITGAWVDGDSGCVVSVERALRVALGEAASIRISEFAADMADEDLDEDCESEDDDFDLDDDASNAAFLK